MIGEVISHYRVLERLGEGGMGEVYLVEDLKLHRKAALKLIAEHLTRDEDRRQRFVQEATLAASIEHPHIAAIYEIDETNGRTFIAMEYVQGRSLRETLRGGPLKPRRAIELAIQIADALAKVHERGVVHRDLKPENVLIADEGYAKIIDFGVAKLADPFRQSGLADAATMTDARVRTADGVVLGTMAYMSPEQARGETVDARSDTFSFGAVFQEMLTGASPFRRGSAAETLSAILTQAAAPVQVDAGGAEPELQRVIRKCLVKEAGGRYQSMRDVVVDLREAREMLVTGLAQTPDFEVVGLERLSDAAKQIGKTAMDEVPRTQLSDVARRAGARFVVTGSLVQAGDELRIDARVEDLTSGGVRFAGSVRGRDAFALADDLSARIRAGLNISPTGAVRKVAEVASGSVDAYRAYTSGAEATYNARWDDARRLLEEAVRLDPNFAYAYYLLATVARIDGRDADRQKNLARAAEHLDRMPERDAQLVRAALARAEGRMDDAERLLEVIVARYPDAESAHIELGLMLMPLFGEWPDPQKALAALERGVRALPYSGGLRNLLGYAQMNAGRLEDAVATFEVYVKLRPSEANALDSLAEGHMVAGNLTQAVNFYGQALDAGRQGSRQGRAWANGVLGRYDAALADVAPTGFTRWFVLSRLGRYHETEQQIRDERHRSDTGAERVVALALVESAFALERGDCESVSRGIEATKQSLGRLSESQRRQWIVLSEMLSGTCHSRLKHVDRARASLERARQAHIRESSNERWWVHALEGEIALATGDAAGASRSFAAGEPARKMVFGRTGNVVPLAFLANNLTLRDGTARAAAAAGRTDEAIALYRALLTPGRESKWTAMLEPRYVLALARLLEKAGQRKAARAEYQRFLDLWKDADRNLPELAEARNGLKRVS